MHRDHYPAEAIPDFESLERALTGAGALIGAAQAHGMLCGMLCAQAEIDEDAWLEQVLGRIPDPEEADCPGMLRRLHRATMAELADHELAFQPLLPPDERVLPERVAALREWCEGFLFGFGALARGEMEAQPEATRELVRDLAELARLADEPAPGGEDDEVAYAELVEYVKVGALTARTERLMTVCGRARGSRVH